MVYGRVSYVYVIAIRVILLMVLYDNLFRAYYVYGIVIQVIIVDGTL